VGLGRRRAAFEITTIDVGSPQDLAKCLLRVVASGGLSHRWPNPPGQDPKALFPAVLGH